MAHEPVLFVLDNKKDAVEFRFTVSSAMALERAAGCAPWVLAARGQTALAMVLMLQYALKWKVPALTEEQAQRMIDKFLDQGGDSKLLADKLAQAMRQSGVYGQPERPSDGSEDDDEVTATADPTKTKETTP